MMHYTLRDIVVERDLDYFHAVHSDAESVRYYGMEPSASIVESEQLLRAYVASMSEGKSLHKVICRADTSEYCGEIGLFNMNERHHRANSYCILLPKYRKQGISRAISKVFYDYIFSTTEINRIQAFVDSRNRNAKTSLEGIGYNYEGRLAQYEYEGGEYIDIDVYSLLRKDYESQFGKM
ncbi:MAG TPA: GNAT family N-acetyltransferase [Candidatus Avimuribaculum pullicola]|nr:GNAT family N-acetyltransferase [Candidatus Avimuribaculum pullicola]